MRSLFRGIGWVGLGASWLMLCVVLAVFISITMAPWDAALVTPPADSWQMQLNNLFDNGGYGGWLLAGNFILLSIALSLRAIRRNSRSLFSILFMNAITIFSIPSAVMLAWTINHSLLFPLPPTANFDVIAASRGFHHSVLPMLAMFVMLTAWLRWQYRLGDIAKGKRKRTLTASSTQRAEQRAINTLQEAETAQAVANYQMTKYQQLRG